MALPSEDKLTEQMGDMHLDTHTHTCKDWSCPICLGKW